MLVLLTYLSAISKGRWIYEKYLIWKIKNGSLIAMETGEDIQIH